MSKINVYNCANQHKLIIKNCDSENVTPFFITCPTCKINMTSSGYMCSQELKPIYEWFIPSTIQELKESCINAYGDVFEEEDYEYLFKKKSLMYRKIV